MEQLQGWLAGRYRLGELLGRGGTADVYRATDVSLGRDVAVKIFRSTDFEESDRDRFRVEVGALATLEHPHLVQVIDAGVDDERPWCAMQLVDGGTFSSLPKPLALRRLVAIGAEIAAALACVHERGIVHRDVKQSNILLDAHGRAYLSDFGSARLVNITGMTLTGRLIGTAAYLSPEQVQGQGATSASDVYALGLVLLEGWTGRREYPGGPIESAVARLYRAPVIPAGLPEPFGRLLRAMTAYQPAARPAAAAVADLLSGAAPDGAGTVRIDVPGLSTPRLGPLSQRRPGRTRRRSVAGEAGRHVGRQVATVLTAAAAGALVATAAPALLAVSDPQDHQAQPSAVTTAPTGPARGTGTVRTAVPALNATRVKTSRTTSSTTRRTTATAHPQTRSHGSCRSAACGHPAPRPAAPKTSKAPEPLRAGPGPARPQSAVTLDALRVDYRVPAGS